MSTGHSYFGSNGQMIASADTYNGNDSDNDTDNADSYAAMPAVTAITEHITNKLVIMTISDDK